MQVATAATCAPVIVLHCPLRQVGAAQHPELHLSILQHTQADSILPHAHKATSAINGIKHPVATTGATRALAQLCRTNTGQTLS